MSVTTKPTRPNLEQPFPGDSEMARRMRAYDWSQSALGQPQEWPENLRVALGICLTSRFPMHVWWGPSLTLFYNDACISFLGPARHPVMLGRSGREAWAESWSTIGPTIDGVFARGEAGWSEDIQMFVARSLGQEEVYVTFSFSPVFGEDQRVDGMYCACTETTEKIVGARRLDTLRKLGVEGMIARSADEACAAAIGVLQQNPRDLPFGSIYVFDEARGVATSAGLFGLADTTTLPSSVNVTQADQTIWPLAQVLRTKRSVELTDIAETVVFRTEPWPEPIRTAMILPLRSAARDSPSGLLVVGVSPRQPMTDAYRTFFELVADYVATAIAATRELLAHADRQLDLSLARKDALTTMRESHDALERRMDDRTRELGLREAELARELEDARQLQVVSSQIIRHDDIQTLCNQIVDAAISLTRSDFGSLQVYRPEDDELELVASKGFHPDSRDFWTRVGTNSLTSCGAALRRAGRVIIEDTSASALMAGSIDLHYYELSGIRAVHSTPLVTRSGVCVGMLSTHWRTPHRPTDRELGMIDLLARQAADLIERQSNVDALRRAHGVLEQRVLDRTQELQVLLRRLVNAQDEERKRIARDIHDQVGQQLTALRLNLEALDGGEHSDHASGATQRVQQLCEELDRSIDFLVWSLRPAILDHLGLPAALNDLVRGWSARFGIPVEYQARAVNDLQFSPDIETNLYRIAQEALHNVHKHAHASRVAVSFERHGDRAVLTIEDDGRGFQTADGSIRNTDGLGLVSIRERAALVGGEVEIESSPGRGTTVFLQIPV